MSFVADNTDVRFTFHVPKEACPAEPGYTMPLQTV